METAPVSNVTALSKAMVFTTGTGSEQNAHDQAKIRALLDAARNSRSFADSGKHMLVAEGADEAALDLDIQTMGPRAAWESWSRKPAAARQTRAANGRFTRDNS